MRDKTWRFGELYGATKIDGVHLAPGAKIAYIEYHVKRTLENKEQIINEIVYGMTEDEMREIDCDLTVDLEQKDV